MVPRRAALAVYRKRTEPAHQNVCAGLVRGKTHANYAGRYDGNPGFARPKERNTGSQWSAEFAPYCRRQSETDRKSRFRRIGDSLEWRRTLSVPQEIGGTIGAEGEQD